MKAPTDSSVLRGQSLLIRAASTAGLLMMASCTVFAQLATRAITFDVASVRPNVAGVNGGSLSRSGGRILFENVSLRECIAYAYGVPTGRDYQLLGPDWLEAVKFDITATFSPDASRDRVREMMQALLAERFSLKTHNEKRKFQSYALVVGKRGPMLHPGTDGDGAFIFGEDHVVARATSMSEFADRLSGPVFRLGRPVVDTTGIKGAYDFTLNWAPEDASISERSGASIFTALQEQLGLKLEARKIVFNILVVDHADKTPTGN